MQDTAFLKDYECTDCKQKNSTVLLMHRVKDAADNVLVCEKCTRLSRFKEGVKPKPLTELQFKLLFWTHPDIAKYMDSLRKKIMKEQFGLPLNGFMHAIIADFLKKHL